VNKSAGANGPYNPVITGTGSAVPVKTLTNADFTKIVDTSDEWIITRTGIKVRHVAGEGETTATLSAEAARRALADADLDAEEVELIIVATVTPEMVFPSTACFVQDMIGAQNAWAFDLAAACSGFVYGLSIVQQFINTGRYRNALVIGAAVIVERSESGPLGIMYSTSASDGSAWSSLKCEAYGSRYPVGKPLDDPKKALMYINGREVYQLAIRRIVEIVNDCLDHCNLKAEDIKMYIPHQMNARIIESAAKRLNLPNDKVFLNIDKYGNTSAASIPIALDECCRQGKIGAGDIVLLVAFGGGLTWGANVIEF